MRYQPLRIVNYEAMMSYNVVGVHDLGYIVSCIYNEYPICLPLLDN